MVVVLLLVVLIGSIIKSSSSSNTSYSGSSINSSYNGSSIDSGLLLMIPPKGCNSDDAGHAAFKTIFFRTKQLASIVQDSHIVHQTFHHYSVCKAHTTYIYVHMHLLNMLTNTLRIGQFNYTMLAFILIDGPVR